MASMTSIFTLSFPRAPPQSGELADAHADLAAGRARKNWQSATRSLYSCLAQPTPFDDVFRAEIAEMRDRPAERCQAQPQRDQKDFGKRTSAGTAPAISSVRRSEDRSIVVNARTAPFFAGQPARTSFEEPAPVYRHQTEVRWCFFIRLLTLGRTPCCEERETSS